MKMDERIQLLQEQNQLKLINSIKRNVFTLFPINRGDRSDLGDVSRFNRRLRAVTQRKLIEQSVSFINYTLP